MKSSMSPRTQRGLPAFPRAAKRDGALAFVEAGMDKNRSMHRLRFLAIVFAMLLEAPTGWTAVSSVKVSVLDEYQTFRSLSPATLRLQIDNSAAGIRDGLLEATVDGTMVPFVHEIPVVLSPGKNLRVVTLPPLATSGADLLVRFRFKEGGKVSDAGEKLFTSAGSWHTHLILTSTSQQNASSFQRMLQLERLYSKQTRWPSRTSFAKLAADELPQNPLGYMVCDIVMLDAGVLASAKEKVLDALAQWVGAGGSVFIHLPADAPRSETVDGFLAKLRIDELANLPRDNAVEMTAPGLGRAVIWRSEFPTETTATPEWDKAVMWLWKTTPELLAPDGRRNYSNNGSFSDLVRTRLSEELSRGAQAIQFRTIAGIFLAFVVLAVSVDYFLLGPKYRKFTWITFPLECAAFAWALMAFANHRIGRVERSGAVVLTDVGKDGRVLRETKITAYLPGAPGLGEHAAKGAITVSVSAISFGGNQPFTMPRYSGNIGGAMSVQTQRAKWTPCFFRDTRIPAAHEPAVLDWQRWEAMAGAKAVTIDGYEITRFANVNGGASRWSSGTPWAGFADLQPNWNFSEPVSQCSPNSSPFSMDDLNFPLGVNAVEIIFATKTAGTTTYVFRKIIRNSSPK